MENSSHNTGWQRHLLSAHEHLLKEHDTRELGKFYAMANEHMHVEWISENTCLKARLRDDSDHNGTGYDLICDSGLRIQSKFRGGMSGKRPNLFIEQTRRISEKNLGAASKSGHVVPAIGECVVYLFTIPRGEYSDPSKAEILAIPEHVLEDPKNPGFLRSGVPAAIQDEYHGRTAEVLEELERTLKLREVS